MHCRLLTQYAIIMVQFLAGLRKIKLRAAPPPPPIDPGYGPDQLDHIIMNDFNAKIVGRRF